MSAERSYWIRCDECHEAMSNMDMSASTATDARQEARDDGGHRSKGRDICETCWQEGVR